MSVIKRQHIQPKLDLRRRSAGEARSGVPAGAEARMVKGVTETRPPRG